MNKEEFNKKEFKIYGFKFNLKYTLIGLAIAIGVLTLLLIVDNFITDVSWYGVIIGSAFLVALFVAIQMLPTKGYKAELAYDLLWWIFPFAIVGARAYYVILEKLPLFWEAFEIWNGGIAIYGGIIGGAVGAIICCLIKKVNIIKVFDVLAPCLIIGQAIGRWGNFVNQEVYGFEVTNPTYQFFPIAVYITKFGLNEWHLATFFYESIWNLAWFFVLVYICRKSKIHGISTCVYLISYGVARYFLEGLRMKEFILTNNSGIPASQIVSIVCVVVGSVGLISLLVARMIKNKKLETEKN